MKNLSSFNFNFNSHAVVDPFLAISMLLWRQPIKLIDEKLSKTRTEINSLTKIRVGIAVGLGVEPPQFMLTGPHFE